ncbi:spermidine synthase [Xenorhabdus hominickii]|uniref:Spermidine synthase n=1 Tax=Xenorhabdus hominickii TaxID=351679 RepID=A0A2G0Q493_XENHO|nr:spermidine synthase [Xenorhabdus hominickii]
MTFAWATQNPTLRQVPLAALQQRFENSGITCRYYTPAIHAGSFALQQYLLNALSGSQ